KELWRHGVSAAEMRVPFLQKAPGESPGAEWKSDELVQNRSGSLGRPFRLAFTAFEDLFTHFLGGSLDFLHLLADAGSGGLIPTGSLLDIVGGLIHEFLQGVIFLQWHSEPPKCSFSRKKRYWQVTRVSIVQKHQLWNSMRV